MSQITFQTTSKKQILDITEDVQAFVDSSGQENGLCHVFVLHTTAAITTADLDPGTDLDMLDAFEAIIPTLQYRHPHNPDHVGITLCPASLGQMSQFHLKMAN